MTILTTENKGVKTVFFKKLDFRSIVALAMIKKSTGRLLVNNENNYSAIEKDFILGVSFGYEEKSDFQVIYQSLEDVFADFSDVFKSDSYKAREIFVSDFVKQVDKEITNPQNGNNNPLIKYMNSMLDICFENVSKELLYVLIEIAEKLIDEEAEKAIKKHEEYEYFATCKVEDKVIILDKMVDQNNLATYLNEAKSDVLFAVISGKNEYKYTVIPLAKDINIPKKKVPEMFTNLKLEQIRVMTGAKSLKYVNLKGYGGVCGTFEDAVRMATLSATL